MESTFPRPLSAARSPLTPWVPTAVGLGMLEGYVPLLSADGAAESLCLFCACWERQNHKVLGQQVPEAQTLLHRAVHIISPLLYPSPTSFVEWLSALTLQDTVNNSSPSSLLRLCKPPSRPAPPSPLHTKQSQPFWSLCTRKELHPLKI